MNRIFKLKSWHLFLILFTLFPLQVISGIGLNFGEFIIGAFPNMIIYSVWMLLLLSAFKEKMHIQTQKVINIKSVKILMKITIFFAIPAYWLIVNYMFRSPISSIPVVLGIPFVIYFPYVAIRVWVTLSKALYLLSNQKEDYNVGFNKYKNLFFYFLLGPLTIWFLQPKIEKVENR